MTAKTTDITPLKSSWLTGFEYDPKTRVLKLHTTDGKVLPHLDVPAEKVAALEGAKSAGAYYNAKIKPTHLAPK